MGNDVVPKAATLFLVFGGRKEGAFSASTSSRS